MIRPLASHTTRLLAATLCIVLLPSLLCSSVWAQESTEKKTTLQEAVRLAVHTHPSVLTEIASKEAAEHEARSVFGELLPQVDMYAEGGGERSHNEVTRSRALSGKYDSEYHSLLRNEQRLSLKQLIYDGRKTVSRKEAAELRASAAALTVEDRAEQIGLRALEAYLDVLRYERMFDLASENVNQHMEILEKTRIRAEAGGGTIADLEQARSRLSSAKDRLLDIQGALRDARSRYLEAVGTLPAELIMPELSDDSPITSLDQAVARALAENRGIKSSRQEVEARTRDLKVAQAAFQPRLGLELSTSRTENLDGLEGAGLDCLGMVTLNYNLYSGGSDQAALRRSRTLLLRARLQARERTRDVEKQSRLAFNAMTTAAERLPVLRENREKSTQVLAAYNDQFILGKRSLLDLLDAQNELYTAKVNLLNGEVGYIYARYSILVPMTGLLKQLDISIPETLSEQAGS